MAALSSVPRYRRFMTVYCGSPLTHPGTELMASRHPVHSDPGGSGYREPRVGSVGLGRRPYVRPPGRWSRPGCAGVVRRCGVGKLVELIRMRRRALAQPCVYAFFSTSTSAPHTSALPRTPRRGQAVRDHLTLPERGARHTGAATGFSVCRHLASVRPGQSGRPTQTCSYKGLLVYLMSGQARLMSLVGQDDLGAVGRTAQPIL